MNKEPVHTGHWFLYSPGSVHDLNPTVIVAHSHTAIPTAAMLCTSIAGLLNSLLVKKRPADVTLGSCRLLIGRTIPADVTSEPRRQPIGRTIPANVTLEPPRRLIGRLSPGDVTQAISSSSSECSGETRIASYTLFARSVICVLASRSSCDENTIRQRIKHTHT